MPADTEALFPADDQPSTPDADSITYSETEVPRIYITTSDGTQVTSKDEFSPCNVRFELNGIFAEYENTYTDENGGGAQLRCRGNSSYSRAEMRAKNKYSYKLKLDTKADLFGFGANRDWYLISNWFDVSALRNKLAYDFSGALGLAYTQNTWVELYYNEEYRGLYLLTESIEIDDGRVETVNWEEFAEDVANAYATANSLSAEDTELLCSAMRTKLGWITSGTVSVTLSGGKQDIDLTAHFNKDSLDLTSGYLIEYDGRLDGERSKWKTGEGVAIALDNPEQLSSNRTMVNYVRDLTNDFEEALFSDTFFNDKGKHYSEYLDVDSLVDFWLTWTLFGNGEFGYLSMYYYIDGGKIHFGPCWDFDYAAGNTVTLPEKWVGYTHWVTDRNKAWYQQIMGDPYFSVLCQERWFEIRELTDDLLRSLDIYKAYMGDEAVRCCERNGVRANWSLKELNDGHSYDFETDYEHLKSWLNGRVKWLDDMLCIPDANIDDSGNTRSPKLLTSINLEGKELEYELISGRGVYADYIIDPSATGKIELTVSTTHTTATSCSVYLNGTKLIGEKLPLGTKTKAVFSFDVSELDLTDGAINVLYVPAFKSNGSLRSMTSVLIRTSSVHSVQRSECALLCGDGIYIAKKGEPFVMPDIPEIREGFVAEGWTDGETVYKAGETVIPSSSAVYYVRWKRTDIFSAMDMSRYNCESVVNE